SESNETRVRMKTLPWSFEWQAYQVADRCVEAEILMRQGFPNRLREEEGNYKADQVDEAYDERRMGDAAELGNQGACNDREYPGNQTRTVEHDARGCRPDGRCEKLHGIDCHPGKP